MAASDSATRYRQIRPRGARTLLRAAALSAFAAGGALTGKTHRLLARPRVQIILLHHVFPDEEPRFRALLRSLANRHRFISYAEAVRRIQDGSPQKIDHPYVAFTFDDGLKSCTRAAAILSEFGTRACFFICPGIIGEKDPAKIREFCTTKLELPSPVEFMSWEDLARLRDAGHEIGAHTLTHANLAELPHREAVNEIRQSVSTLRSRFGPIRHFAWTYGRFWHITPLAVKAVYEAGCESCASGERGAHPPFNVDAESPARSRSPHICIRRDHVVAAWPVSHTRCLLARTAAAMTPASTNWPQRWAERIA